MKKPELVVIICVNSAVFKTRPREEEGSMQVNVILTVYKSLIYLWVPVVAQNR